jgi:hypothetical protein
MSDGIFDDELVHDWLSCIADNAWISLHYESPALMGLDRGEISGGGYVRRKVSFSTPSSRAMWSLEPVKFSGLPANRLTHFGIWNHKENGRIRAYGRLPGQGVIIPDGHGYVLSEGKIALSID